MWANPQCNMAVFTAGLAVIVLLSGLYLGGLALAYRRGTLLDELADFPQFFLIAVCIASAVALTTGIIRSYLDDPPKDKIEIKQTWDFLDETGE